MFKTFILTTLILGIANSHIHANEVLNQEIEILVKEHSPSQKPYIVVTQKGLIRKDLEKHSKTVYRPNYQMLKKGVRAKDVDYQGPVSSRKKVYLLAASLATAGTLTTLLPTAATASSGGSGLGGIALTGATVTGGHLLKPQEISDDFIHESESKLQ